MISKLLNAEMTLEEFSKNVKENQDVLSALNFYKVFGHVGIFDELFLNSTFKYMLRFPQVYFSKTYSGPLSDSLKNVSEKFSSKVFSESLNPDLTTIHLEIFQRNAKKVYVNKDGNFVMRSSTFEFVANFKNSLLTILDKLKKVHFSP